MKWVKYNPRSVLPKSRKYCLVRIAARPEKGLPESIAIGYGKWFSDGHMWIVPGVSGLVTHYSDYLGDDFEWPCKDLMS